MVMQIISLSTARSCAFSSAFFAYIISYQDLFPIKNIARIRGEIGLKPEYRCIMEVNSNTKLNGECILRLFIESGLHPRFGNAFWPKAAVCVCLVTFFGGRKTLLLRQCSPHHHAEHGVIEYLRRVYHGRVFSVKIYCNYSPCSKPGFECCSRIFKMKEDLMRNFDERMGAYRFGDSFSFEFIFAQIYNIARPSCWRRRCFLQMGPYVHSQPEPNDRSVGILCSFGPNMRSFQGADWEGLIDLLATWDMRCGISHVHICFPYLMSIRFGEYGNWRDIEDAKVRTDFEILKRNYSPSTCVSSYHIW
ncbi:uncharacterized protein LOC121409601 [Lytechinus variegatus]|uniref:uncharacterized protein LOC121409601 n=1 Tax=Lytechinus variegatus TaxID=7654 RepID=UPI001BB1CE46|nr:uncharacterized protein LOC121409601 [Lytechinus variegatus]